ncbi:MAG: TFIIB-type zinc ribbon-containing protein [Candidatus Pacearchaeota archaeon]
MPYVKRCPECKSVNLTYDEQRGEIICNDCGLIVEEKMVDTGQDVGGQFDKTDKKGRGGAPMSHQKFDKGLTTNVGEISDIYKLESGQTRKFLRLKKWQERVSTSIERNLRLAMAELRRVASFLNLPSVVRDEASRVYNFVLQRGLVRGRSMESVIAACIYAACRSYNIPRTLDEIATASDVERKEIGRTYRFIVRKLKIKVTPSSPKDYISRFASILHLSPKSQNEALKILKRADISELTSGRGPAGIAAAALYVAALMNDEKKTQREVADVAGITEVTIRNRYKELIERLGLEEKLKAKVAAAEKESAKEKQKESSKSQKSQKKKGKK